MGGVVPASRWLVVGVLIVGCSDHAADPKTCRERTAFILAEHYPDPVNLAAVIDTVCGNT